MVLGFFIGPMYLSNFWGYMQSRRHLTEAAFSNIRSVAALEAAETREFIRAAENLVFSIVAGNHFLFQVVRLLEDATQDRAQLSESLRGHLAAKAGDRSTLREYQVLSSRGRMLASSGTGWTLDSDLSGSRCYRAGLVDFGVVGFRQPRPASTPPSQGPPGSGSARGDRTPQLVIAGPIRDPGGELLGVFCAHFSCDLQRGSLPTRKRRGDPVQLHLLDEQGQAVCDPSGTGPVAPWVDSRQWLDKTGAGKGETWEGRYGETDGSEVMVAYAPVSKLGLGVVAEVPVTHALAGLERLKWEAMAASGLLALGIALAAFLSWRTFMLPLRALSRASERMVSGAAGETVVPGGPREISDLARAFNRMSLALRDSQESLESRIAERTLELRESREFLELLLDSIDQRVVVVNRDFEIIKANAAAERMHARKLIGERCHEVFEGEASPPEAYPVRRTFETGQTTADERSQRTVRGVEVVYVETYPMFDVDGRVESVVEIGRVVTAEKKLQMQMVYQEKMAAFGQLAAGIAHEIGNPLAAIESQLQMAQQDPRRVEQTLGVVRKQVGRMHRMLRRLVNFTRRKRDEVTLISANQVVDDVAQLLEHDPRARRIAIKTLATEGLLGIRAKEDDLVQVILNLGMNAIDAVGDEGTVEFETAAEDGYVVVRVRDTGHGVSENARSQLFEPFFTTKAPGRGTGLGLFVSKGIIEAMNGALELEQTGPEGSTFLVRLPTGSAEQRGEAA
ncbi:MAG: ATP-binding protein [Myxococcota bacterium]